MELTFRLLFQNLFRGGENKISEIPSNSQEILLESSTSYLLLFEDSFSHHVIFVEFTREKEIENEFITNLEVSEKKFDLRHFVHKIERFWVFSYEKQIYLVEIVAFDDRKLSISSTEKS